jgi:hypothetical protein
MFAKQHAIYFTAMHNEMEEKGQMKNIQKT